ncbi:hypothetical protein LY76DRAFT_51865 [Colletotrichum caudatum]|nr:hypothetical protein LY76DRAFT_51865 [Colletotrichum caudatum]
MGEKSRQGRPEREGQRCLQRWRRSRRETVHGPYAVYRNRDGRRRESRCTHHCESDPRLGVAHSMCSKTVELLWGGGRDERHDRESHKKYGPNKAGCRPVMLNNSAAGRGVWDSRSLNIPKLLGMAQDRFSVRDRAAAGAGAGAGVDSKYYCYLRPSARGTTG